MIRFLEREKVNTDAWDALIRRSSNGLVYALSGFLDNLSPGWCALVSDNFDAVMPLTQRKKYGISYLYQPPFLQQLGIFGITNAETNALFISTAKKHYQFAEINLNTTNPCPGTIARQNFVLSLDRPYDEIAAGFSTAHSKNLKRAGNAGLRYVHSQAIESNVNLNYSLIGSSISTVKRFHYDAIIALAGTVSDHVMSREVWKDEDLQASCVCFVDHRRIYFILSTVTETGKHHQANHFLIDQLIREYSGQQRILDLEGSDIPGVAEFYKGFGAINEPYYFLKWNNLPWPLKLLKK
ncbi:MAG TPA: hypothetical protein VLA58_02760 [Chitinophagaceae bacterium]|nr:hypothetical protein [Chitinophagaceae bacterium]